MTQEILFKAKLLQKHINELANFKEELSIATLVRAGSTSVKFSETDIEALKKTLEERIANLEKEFDAL